MSSLGQPPHNGGASSVGSSLAAAASPTAGSLSAAVAPSSGHAVSLSSSSVASASYSSLKIEMTDLRKQFEALQQTIDGEVLEAFRRLRQQSTDIGEKVELLMSSRQGSEATGSRPTNGTSDTAIKGVRSGSPAEPHKLLKRNIDAVVMLEARVTELASSMSEMQNKSAVENAASRLQMDVAANDRIESKLLRMSQSLDTTETKLGHLAERQMEDMMRIQEQLCAAVDTKMFEQGKELLEIIEERCAATGMQARAEQDERYRGMQKKLAYLDSRVTKVDGRLDPADYFQSLEDRVCSLGSCIEKLRNDLRDELFKGLREELMMEIAKEIRTELGTAQGKEAWLMAAFKVEDKVVREPSPGSAALDAVVAAIQSATRVTGIQDEGTWEVLTTEYVCHIRSQKSIDAEIIGCKTPGLRFRGVQDGTWLRLVDEPGFVTIQAFGEPEGEELLRRVKEVASPATSSFTPLGKLDTSNQSFDEPFKVWPSRLSAGSLPDVDSVSADQSAQAWDTMRREPTEPTEPKQRVTRLGAAQPTRSDTQSDRGSHKSAVSSGIDSPPRRGRQAAGKPVPTEPEMQDVIVQVSPYRPQSRAMRTAARQGSAAPSGGGSPPPFQSNARGPKEEVQSTASDDGCFTPPPRPGAPSKHMQKSGSLPSRLTVPQTPPLQSRDTLPNQGKQPRESRPSKSPTDRKAAEGPKKRSQGKLSQIEEKAMGERSLSASNLE